MAVNYRTGQVGLLGPSMRPRNALTGGREDVWGALAYEEMDPLHRRGIGSAAAISPIARGGAPTSPPAALSPSVSTPSVTQNPQPAAPAEEEEPYDFTGSPGYQWRYNEGLRALENGLIGRGLGLSGRAVKEAQRFGQNYAADEFSAEFARNATLAGLTPPSINSMNSLIGGFAANAGNLAMNQGQIGAQSAYNNANIWGNALNNLIQGMGMYYGGGFGG